MSVSIQESDIDKLASLARLKVAPGERASLAKDIEAILAYVSELESVKLEEETREKNGLRNVTRRDEVSHESGANTSAILDSAPRSEAGYVVVKKIL